MNCILKKIGYGYMIYFSKEEIESLGYKAGDVIKVSDIVKLNKEVKNDKTSRSR